jgi:hypothetical protein
MRWTQKTLAVGMTADSASWAAVIRPGHASLHMTLSA